MARANSNLEGREFLDLKSIDKLVSIRKRVEVADSE
jgi:hypothetical protein